MSASRAKRQFAGAAADPAQRQITAFFPKAPEASAAPPPPLQGPVLPASVQANLLTVGMRIRKAVPEGYKMAGATSVFKLWTDPATTAADITTTTIPVRPSPAAVASVARELLPFCGINKIGGMAPQPELRPLDDLPALDDVPEFTISQETIDSDDCEVSRKRGFDERDRVHGVGGLDAAQRGLVDSVRVFAIPRSRVKEGEGMPVDDDGDFEEASFLVFNDAAAPMDLSSD